MRKTTPHAIDLYKCNAAYEGGINQKFSFDPATYAKTVGRET